MVGDILVPGFVQDVVGRGYHVVRGQRRSVRKAHIGAQVERPDLAAGAFFPALGNATLRDIIVVNGDQTFVEDVVNGQNIPFLRLERADRERLGALDADRDTGPDIFG